MSDPVKEDRPKRDLTILGKELGIAMKGSPADNSDPNNTGKNTKNTENTDAPAPPADPKDAKIDVKSDEDALNKDNKDNKDNNDNKVDDSKKYQLGGKFVDKSEVVKELNNKFKGKYDFNKLDEDSFQVYYDLLKDAKDGENKKEWQKSMGERENQIAVEKKKLNEEISEYDSKVKELTAEKAKLKKLVGENIDENEDLTDDEKLDKKVDQKLAKKELDDIAKKERKLLQESQRLEALQAKLLFYDDHNKLSKEFPELETSIHIKDVFAKHATKQAVDEHDVRIAFAVFKIVNDAIDYGMTPTEYYKYYKDNYKIPARINKSSDKINKNQPSEKTAEELAAEELIKRAEELKKKQEAAPGIPPGSKQVDPNPPQRGHVIPGKTEKQKMDYIISGGQTK